MAAGQLPMKAPPSPCLSGGRRVRMTVIATCLACLLVVLRVAIPRQVGVRLGHFGWTGRHLNSDCVRSAINELDAGSRIVEWADGARVTDAQIHYAGGRSELWVTQRETGRGWELVAFVRRDQEIPTSASQQSSVEATTRRAALHILERCSSESEWDGAVRCERRGSEKAAVCIGN